MSLMTYKAGEPVCAKTQWAAPVAAVAVAGAVFFSAIAAFGQDETARPEDQEPAVETNVGAGEIPQTFDAAVTNAHYSTNLPSTNDVSPAGAPGETNVVVKSDGGDRRSRRSRAERNRLPGSNPDFARESDRDSRANGSTNTPARGQAEFSNFRIIAERNIFDPNRSPRRPNGPRERPKVVESFGLVGIMSYEKGTFAFFDGSSTDYRKALKSSDTIAGYALAAIETDYVKLKSGTNELELRVGSQVRREEGSDWKVFSQPEIYAASSSSTASSNGQSSPPASSGADNDVLKKLMQRREQE